MQHCRYLIRSISDQSYTGTRVSHIHQAVRVRNLNSHRQDTIYSAYKISDAMNMFCWRRKLNAMPYAYISMYIIYWQVTPCYMLQGGYLCHQNENYSTSPTNMRKIIALLCFGVVCYWSILIISLWVTWLRLFLLPNVESYTCDKMVACNMM